MQLLLPRRVVANDGMHVAVDQPRSNACAVRVDDRAAAGVQIPFESDGFNPAPDRDDAVPVEQRLFDLAGENEPDVADDELLVLCAHVSSLQQPLPAIGLNAPFRIAYLNLFSPAPIEQSWLNLRQWINCKQADWIARPPQQSAMKFVPQSKPLFEHMRPRHLRRCRIWNVGQLLPAIASTGWRPVRLSLCWP